MYRPLLIIFVLSVASLMGAAHSTRGVAHPALRIKVPDEDVCRRASGLSPLAETPAPMDELALHLLLRRLQLLLDEDTTSGNLIVHLAAYEGCKEVVKHLVDSSKDLVTAKNRYDELPIHLAARAGHEAVVETLAGYDSTTVNNRDSSGNTPLHAAAGAGKVAMVQYLIERWGANPSLKNKAGFSVPQWAKHRKQRKVEEYFARQPLRRVLECWGDPVVVAAATKAAEALDDASSDSLE